MFLTFAKIGAFTIGGGWAMIPLIEKDVVEKKKWISKEEFIDIIAIAQSLPGVLAVNTAIFVGYRLKKIPGGILCMLASILPSFFIILLIAIFFKEFQHYPTVAAIFKGIRPAVVALILVPVFTTAKSSKINIRNVFIPICAALLIWLLGVSPVWIVLAAGVGGIIWSIIKMKSER
ncbi:chromate transporter [Odoribacter sp. OttesenSCG-928-L07]|nr:chromate transporter [Odoribacter sp. OttesenSCG-928-L07]